MLPQLNLACINGSISPAGAIVIWQASGTTYPMSEVSSLLTDLGHTWYAHAQVFTLVHSAVAWLVPDGLKSKAGHSYMWQCLTCGIVSPCSEATTLYMSGPAPCKPRPRCTYAHAKTLWGRAAVQQGTEGSTGHRRLNGNRAQKVTAGPM